MKKKKGQEGNYYFWKTDIMYKAKMVDYWVMLADKYPIISLEDGVAEEDWSMGHAYKV